jgi:hypothetical protein
MKPVMVHPSATIVSYRANLGPRRPSRPRERPRATTRARCPPPARADRQRAVRPAPHDGRLDSVDRAADPRPGTLALWATFPNPARLRRPEQYTRLRVLLEDRESLVVPRRRSRKVRARPRCSWSGRIRPCGRAPSGWDRAPARSWIVEEGAKAGRGQGTPAGSSKTFTDWPLASIDTRHVIEKS